MPDILERPFHAGERAAQRRAGIEAPRAAIRDYMPEQHREFFAHLHYLPVATLDAPGAPVVRMLNGPRGFVASPDPATLHIATAVDAQAFRAGGAIAILGIDLATRRRNRANGTIARVDADGVTVAVAESFGNCPRYITPRAVAAMPTVDEAVQRTVLSAADRALIGRADTMFVASVADGRVDISHRGGPAGFVGIDGDTLVVPDYAGNRYFNTLGNLLVDPRACLLFADFAVGTALRVAGEVAIDWDAPERVWRLRVSSVAGEAQA